MMDNDDDCSIRWSLYHSLNRDEIGKPSTHKAHYDIHNIHLYATYEDKDSTENVT